MRRLSANLSRPRGLCFEEEDGGGGGGGGYYRRPPTSEEELIQVWGGLGEMGSKHPLYALLLGTSTDAGVRAFAENHRREADVMAGSKCCFIYFRNVEKAERLESWSYDEHSKMALPVAKILGIRYDELPLALLFRKLEDGNFIKLSLRDRGAREILQVFREAFSYLHDTDKEPFEALQSYRRAQAFDRAKSKVEGLAGRLTGKAAEAIIKGSLG